MEKGANLLSDSIRFASVTMVAVLAVFVPAGCATSSRDQSAPDISGTSRPFAVLPEAPPALPPPPPIRNLPTTVPESVTVISEGLEKTQPSLIEASRRAKAQKKNEGEPYSVIEITDENLKEFSSGGQVFVLEAGEPDGVSTSQESTTSPESELFIEKPGQKTESTPAILAAAEKAPEPERELFWRQSVAELRAALRHALDDYRRLELESSMLRQQFYSEGDPFVRDNEIKPRWDRSLDQLSAMRKKAQEDRGALTSLLGEAKRAGVSPAWLEGDGDRKLIEDATRLIDGDKRSTQ